MSQTEKAISRCGQCRHFTRVAENQRDVCGAWDQPTSATRFACESFMAKRALRKANRSAATAR